jgi:para-aminobenzoate synthetase component 1
MWQHEIRDWAEPLDVAANVPKSESEWVLFYSSYDTEYTGQRSVIAMRKSKAIKSENFDEIEPLLSSDKTPFADSWFGYLGYGLKNCLEKLPADDPYKISLPNLWLVQYSLILEFNHKTRKLHVWYEDQSDIEYLLSSGLTRGSINNKKMDSRIRHENDKIVNLTSNMTKKEYLEKVGIVKEAISAGDLYQANLTRKFNGEFESKPNHFAIFRELVKNSPSPYSAFMKMEDTYILSSSPERFVTLTYDGKVESRPIKGSARRADNPIEDNIIINNLASSEKDRAENLMIVDLMRNDLSRVCIPGSIDAPSLFDITSYKTVHHMSSTIKGTISPDKTALDLVKACFPPGSMTGAPKIKAMELCSELEKHERGVYSGAIGWFGGDGSVDLSVVIRTLIIQGNSLEFQVGGAIVADSEPEKEWEETLIKARGIAKTLKIEEEQLSSL